MINKEQLKEILKDLHEVAKDYIDNKTIFKEACSYQRGLMCGESRGIQNYQKNKIVDQKPSNESKDTEITPKQKAFLIKIKKYKEGMSKQEAYNIIKDLSNKNKY